MLTAEVIQSRGYSSLQIEAHLAHKERQSRMKPADLPRYLSQPAPPPPPAVVSPQMQLDAHIHSYRLHLSTAAAALGGDFPRVLVSTIQAVICGEFGLTREELLASRRQQRIVWPRQIAFYLACRITTRSLPEIGRRFSGKDHTTVLHGRRKVDARRSFDPGFGSDLNDLELKCRDATELLGSLGRE